MLCLLAVVGFTLAARADDPPKKVAESPTSFTALAEIPPSKRDSLLRLQEERSDRMYDSLQVKSSRRKITRLIYSALFREKTSESVDDGKVLDEYAPLQQYKDRRIGDIFIVQATPFDKDGNWFERAANNTHVLTRERIIRRELLFESGDLFDPQLIVRNKELLQSRSYIADLSIEVLPDPDHPEVVDILVRARDSWTIDFDFSVRGGGATTVGLSESNLLGRAHKLSIETNFNYRNFDYGGNVIEYSIPNILGSFFSFNLEAGRHFESSRFKTSFEKPFLRPIDYNLGATYAYQKEHYHLIDPDTVILLGRREVNFWTGYTHEIESVNSNVYLSGRYNRQRYILRPDNTDQHTNTAFHGYDALLVSFGLYREKFYSTSMIYHYGTREYLSSGYKSEFTMGRLWGEFYDQYYLGLDQMVGGFLSFGFLKGGFSLGSFYDLRTNRFERVTLNGGIGWFSNLFRMGGNQVRQYVSLFYTQGWRRYQGAGEQIEFTDDKGVRALKDGQAGTSRLVLNTETNFFTRLVPLGFKTVLYGFIDGGFTGYDSNVFRNGFFTSFGVGLRFRNERLIFSTIGVRLAVAFGPRGLAPSEYIRVTTETPVNHYRFTPERPEFVTYK